MFSWWRGERRKSGYEGDTKCSWNVTVFSFPLYVYYIVFCATVSTFGVFVCVREIETDIEINRVRKRDRELRKLGSSFPIYIYIPYIRIYCMYVCTTCGYSLLNVCGTAIQSLCKIFALFHLFFLLFVGFFIVCLTCICTAER